MTPGLLGSPLLSTRRALMPWAVSIVMIGSGAPMFAQHPSVPQGHPPLPAGHPPLPAAHPPIENPDLDSEDAEDTSDLTRVHELVDEMLASDPVDGEIFYKLIAEVVDQQSRRGLSVWQSRDAMYTAEQVAFRAECYGRLLENPRTLEYLRATARDTTVGWTLELLTAAVLLADNANRENLVALYEGLVNDTSGRGLVTRQVGRALAALRDTEDDETAHVAQLVLEDLELSAMSREPQEMGLAVQALFHAGETEMAIRHIKEIAATVESPAKALEILERCSAVFRSEGFPPSLIEQYAAMAIEVAEAHWPDEGAVSGSSVMSSRSTAFRTAVQFLGSIAAFANRDFWQEAYLEPRSSGWLGIDGLQSLRFSIQRERRKLDEDQKAELDEFFIEHVREIGLRLFELGESPMDPTEFSEYGALKDARYNSVSYVNSISDRNQDLQRQLAEDEDLRDMLSLIALSKEEKAEGEDFDRLYYGVKDKTETRLVAAKILANLHKHLEQPYPVELKQQALEALAVEVGTPQAAAQQIVEQADWEGEIAFPVIRVPADRFVMDLSLRILRLTGQKVKRGKDMVTITPRDREAKADMDTAEAGTAGE